MRTSKDYSHVTNHYYRPEIATCPHCQQILCRRHIAWRKYIHTLNDVIWVVSYAYHCPVSDCIGYTQVYQSAAAESLSVKHCSFGIDVIAKVGHLRFDNHLSVPKIHQALTQQYQVSICERSVYDVLSTYLVWLRCSQEKAIPEKLAEKSGIILSMDGIQPEEGNETLYIFRDVLSGLVLHAENLLSSDTESLKQQLQQVIALVPCPILGIISDAQRSRRLAAQELLPSVPHQYCHFHYFKELAKPMAEADRAMKKQLKKRIRGIRDVEKKLEQQQPCELTAVIADYIVALRAVLLEDGHYPLKPAGSLIYEALGEITESLLICHTHHAHPLLDKLLKIVQTHKALQQQYEDVKQLHQWLIRIVQILSTDEQQDILPSKEQIRQQLAGYWGYLKRVVNQNHPLSEQIHHLLKTTRSWWAGLFACYQVENIPATNNDLEHFIRKLKGTYRQITGRKNWNNYMLRYGRYCAFHHNDNQTVDECHLGSISYDSFSNQRQPLEERKERLSKMHRFRHRRKQFLSSLEKQWGDCSRKPA